MRITSCAHHCSELIQRMHFFGLDLHSILIVNQMCLFTSDVPENAKSANPPRSLERQDNFMQRYNKEFLQSTIGLRNDGGEMKEPALPDWN